MTDLTRREFGALLAAAPLAAAARMDERPGPRPGEPAKELAPIKARPFPLRQVRLLSGTCYTLQDRNRAYLHTLDPDRLLHMFRLTAGLPEHGPAARRLGAARERAARPLHRPLPLGLRADVQAALGDAEVKAEATSSWPSWPMPDGARRRLSERLSRGVLRPAPPGRQRVGALLHAAQDHGRPARHARARRERAGPGDRARGHGRLDATLGEPLGDDAWPASWSVEYGGHERGALQPGSGDRRPGYYEELAHRFDHERDLRSRWPRAATSCKGSTPTRRSPRSSGAARRYELTGEERDRRRRRVLLAARSRGVARTARAAPATSERWRTGPGHLAASSSGYTQECCCTYNMLKLTRHLFGWTADPPLRRLLRARALERDPRHHEPRRRHDDLLRAPRVRATGSCSAALSTPSGAARARAWSLLQARRQHLLPRRRRQPVRQPLRACPPPVAGEGARPAAGDAFPGRGGDPPRVPMREAGDACSARPCALLGPPAASR